MQPRDDSLLNYASRAGYGRRSSFQIDRNGGLIVGEVFDRNIRQPLVLAPSQRYQGMLLLGDPDVGKTFAMEEWALQDMVAGRGLIFIDPDGKAVKDLISLVPRNRVNDVIYLDATNLSHPVGFNWLEIDPNDFNVHRTRDLLSHGVDEAVDSLYDFGGPDVTKRVKYLIRKSVELLTYRRGGGTVIDVPQMLTSPERATLDKAIAADEACRDIWEGWTETITDEANRDAIDIIKSIWRDFLDSSVRDILGQRRSTFNLRNAIEESKIILVNASTASLGDVGSSLLGMAILQKVCLATMARADLRETERRDFFIYVDEFPRFIEQTMANALLGELAKFHIGTVVASVVTADLLADPGFRSVLEQVDVVASGRVRNDPNHAVSSRIGRIMPAQLASLPNHTVYIRLDSGTAGQVYQIDIPYLNAAVNQQLGVTLARLSTAKYGCSRAEVENDLQRRLNQ